MQRSRRQLSAQASTFHVKPPKNPGLGWNPSASHLAAASGTPSPKASDATQLRAATHLLPTKPTRPGGGWALSSDDWGDPKCHPGHRPGGPK